MSPAQILPFNPQQEKPRVKADIEDGYTQVANTLLVELARFDFSKRQYKVLLAIMARTYRYHQSSTDLELDALCEATGLDATPVSKTTNELAAMKVIFKRRVRKGFNYEINPVISDWQAPVEAVDKTSIHGQNVHEAWTKRPQTMDKTSMTPIDKINLKNNSKDTLVDSGESTGQKRAKKVGLTAAQKATQREWFEKFYYQTYPKRLKPDDALKAWLKLPVDEAVYAQAIAMVALYAQTEDWLRDNGRYIPHPSSWLNAGCWKAAPVVALAQTYTPEQQAVIDLYMANRLPDWADCTEWLSQRVARINAMLTEKPLTSWAKYFEWMRNEVDFSGRDFPVDFDYLCRAETIARARENALRRKNGGAR